MQYNLFLFVKYILSCLTFGQVVSQSDKITHNADSKKFPVHFRGFKLEPIEKRNRLVAYPASIQCISGI